MRVWYNSSVQSGYWNAKALELKATANQPAKDCFSVLEKRKIMYKNSAKRMMDKENIAASYAAIKMPEGWKMRVSNIFIKQTADLWNGPRIETKTDAYRVLSNESEKEKYIAEFGDVVIVFDKEYNVYRVPEFADAIRVYSEAKAIDCAKWGCE